MFTNLDEVYNPPPHNSHSECQPSSICCLCWCDWGRRWATYFISRPTACHLQNWTYPIYLPPQHHQQSNPLCAIVHPCTNKFPSWCLQFSNSKSTSRNPKNLLCGRLFGGTHDYLGWFRRWHPPNPWCNHRLHLKGPTKWDARSYPFDQTWWCVLAPPKLFDWPRIGEEHLSSCYQYRPEAYHYLDPEIIWR